MFYKSDNLCNFLFTYCTLSPYLNRVNSERKEFAPTRSKFFSFRVGPFFRRDAVAAPERVSICLNRLDDSK